ncbi:MAG: nicotinate (nicotinamide) nucleotide adenylyltransferase [Sulfurimonas sp.]|uniref:nicotinate (nicotinamide) nucleotide adenylyltransferase n=1 Tax=Sulfurimonas sp. TaxID=2022749 RepID=UPI0025CED56B|nr:nicotinate (nicotinamide) nucleotide adenylyltransferase [Sulfurimonas sp.]MCK9454943.1 nicotinate (nicotinamide) nucleotide adenylyltransferase [Sulfurimonas sp.]
MDTIALFGGSFDPPHIGHEAIVKALINFKDIDKVIIMPTFLNPFKSKFHAPASLRVEWLKKIFDEFENVEVSEYEVLKKRAVTTIESVEYLLKSYKKIYLIIGADNLSSIDRWSRYDELKELVTFVVVPRDDIEISEHFLRLDVNENISSTELRDNIEISKLPKKCAKEIYKFYKENYCKTELRK